MILTRRRSRIYLAGTLIAGLILSGCGGGGGGSADPSISGVVADGYLQGAKVCSDQNGNKICDADEPFAWTKAGGKYTLEGKNLNLYPLLVEVGENAVDEDTNQAVEAAYTLSAPIPSDMEVPVVVTPITTLVQGMLEENPAMSTNQAVSTLQGRLMVSAQTDLMGDFIAEEGDEYDRLHATARVVAKAMGAAKTAIETAAEDANETVLDVMPAITRLVIENVMEQLDEVIVPAVVEAQAAAAQSPGTSFNPAAFDPASAETTLPDTTDISNDIESAQTAPVKGRFQTILESGGYHWLGIWEHGDSYVESEYGIVTWEDNGALLFDEKEWDHETQQWVARSEGDDFEYVLSNGTWVKESYTQETVTFEEGGSALITNTLTQERIRVSEVSASGKTMASMLPSSFFPFLQDSSALFPDGAIIYKAAWENLSDSYCVDTWTDRDSGADHNRVVTWENDSETLLTSIDEALSVFQYTPGNYNFLYYDKYKYQFAGDGKVKIFNNPYDSYDPSATAIGEGTYEKKTVQGQAMLMIYLPPEFKEYPEETWFLVEWDDPQEGQMVKHGDYIPAGSTSYDDEFGGNQIAFEALKANLNLSAAVSPSP